MKDKGPTIQDLRLVGPGGNAKMGGISLKGAQAPTVRRVDISGFAVGIDADDSFYATIEDVKISINREEAFMINLSQQIPQLNIAQLIIIKNILSNPQNSKQKTESDLDKISKAISGGSKLTEVIYKIWEGLSGTQT